MDILSTSSGADNWRRRREAVYRRDGWRCRVCGAQQGLTAHHIRPKTIGGNSGQGNLVTLCMDCHQSLHAEAARLAAFLVWAIGRMAFQQ